MDDDDRQAQRQQAEIREEQAAARLEEAQAEREAISRARAAVETGDPETIAEAAVDLHRVHALHEALAGHGDRSSASLRRAARATRQLFRLRRG